jgi:hypothetical protein
MEIRPYQICVSADGWYPIRVESSNQDQHYTVMVCPWGEPQDHICECAGYTYRGSCRHQDLAQRYRCAWKQLESDVQQNDSEIKDMKCPKCGGPTKWTIQVK